MNQLILMPLNELDLDEIAVAFKKIGWHKPRSIYESYLQEQTAGCRLVFIAKENGKFCGYVTLKWVSGYSSFADNNIPEIADLNVLPEYRKKGIGTRLIQACEQAAKSQGKRVIGLGVSLTADYGNAQRLYIHLGFLPDGAGIFYQYKSVKYLESVLVDDDLVMFLTKEITIS